MIWIFSYSLLFPLLFSFTVIVQIVPHHLCVQPSAGLRREIFMVYLNQFIGDTVLNGHTDSITPAYMINFNLPHTEQIATGPLMKSMQSCTPAAAGDKSVNCFCFFIQIRNRYLVIFQNTLKPAVSFIPNPKVVIIYLISLDIGTGKIPVAIEVRIYRIAIWAKICPCCHGLQRFVHRGRVPYRKMYSEPAILSWRPFQLSGYQQLSKLSFRVYQESTVVIINGLFDQHSFRCLCRPFRQF